MLEPIRDPLESIELELAENVAKWIQLRGSQLPYDPTDPPLDMDTEPNDGEDAKCYSCGAVFPAGIVSRPIYCPRCGTMNSRAIAIKRANVQV